ncbi:basal cell adhesion molecule [Gastrophryne carolinensis]
MERSPTLLLLLPALILLPGCLCAVKVSVPPTEIGQTAIFKCTPELSSSSKYSIEWSFDNQEGNRVRIVTYTDGRIQVDHDTEFMNRVAMKSDNSLVINNVGVKDEGLFTCRVNAGSEGTSEGSAQLKVFVSPTAPELTVSTQIISITNNEASEVGTCFSHNSYPAPSIEWYKNQIPLNAGAEKNTDLYTTARTTTETSGLYTVSSTLFLKPTKEDIEAKFSCKAVFPLQSGGTSSMESREFKLNLHYYTENVLFTASPNQHIKAGDTVTLKCQGDGHPAPTYVIQGPKGEDLSNNDGISIIQNITKEDAGDYTCEALDFDSPDEIELNKKLTINVHYLNPITLTPPEQPKHSLGGEAMLICTCDGSDVVSYAWKKGDAIVSQNNRHKLQKLTYSDSGVYTCEVTVPSVPGLRKEKQVTITVEGEPELDQLNEDVDVHSEGQEVELSCAAEGYPVPKITWSLADVKASESIVDFKVVSKVLMKFNSKLMNNISCSAKNHLGSKMKKFSLNMNAAPSVAPAQEQSGSSSTAIIAVVVCVFLLLLVVGLFYFLQKKGKLSCGRSEKLPLSQDPASAELAVELKSEKRTDQHGLLGGGGGGSAAEC